MTENGLHASIAHGAGALDITLTGDSLERLTRLVVELERWTRRVNLTAIRDPREIVTRHLMDSLVTRGLLRGDTIIDVGTGAGFPGLPLAITTPDKTFTLLDANAKKLSFVRYIAGELDLANVNIVQARIEDYAPAGGFDTVIARALAPVGRLVELCGHLVGEDGLLLAMKGRRIADELTHIPREWTYRLIELTVPGLRGHARHAIALTRCGERT